MSLRRLAVMAAFLAVGGCGAEPSPPPVAVIPPAAPPPADDGPRPAREPIEDAGAPTEGEAHQFSWSGSFSIESDGGVDVTIRSTGDGGVSFSATFGADGGVFRFGSGAEDAGTSP